MICFDMDELRPLKTATLLLVYLFAGLRKNSRLTFFFSCRNMRENEIVLATLVPLAVYHIVMSMWQNV